MTGVSPHARQLGFRLHLTVRNSMSSALKSSRRPVSSWPTPTMILMASVASIVPMTPGSTPNTPLSCTGSYHYGNRDFRCYKEGGHGTLSLHRAMVESCDVFFYQVGLKVGVDRIAYYAKELGLGKPTGISLPHEKPGIIPSTAWKKKRFGTAWYSGETLSIAVGQGYVNATPLQLVTLISTVANGGRLYLPQAVEKVQDIHGRGLKEYPPIEAGKAHISPNTLSFIREALTGVVNEPHGTGWAAAVKGVKVAGKTGTAQVVRMAQNFKKGDTNRMALKFRDTEPLPVPISWGEDLKKIIGRTATLQSPVRISEQAFAAIYQLGTRVKSE